MAHPKDIKPGDMVEFDTPDYGPMGMRVDRVEPVEAYRLGNDDLQIYITVLGDTDIRILPKGTRPRG